jgi:Xaa-Pro dipeptidase
LIDPWGDVGDSADNTHDRGAIAAVCDICVPAQYPTARPLAHGDALVCEISASYWEYTGQLLRTFAVAAEPTPLYRELHEVADAAFDAIDSAAAARGRQRGRPGRGLGGDRGRRLHHCDDLVTLDESAGVQTGELLLVTEGGVERLHRYERGLLRAPDA